MNPIVKVMSSGFGRGLRIVAGAGLITAGLLAVGGDTGVIMAGIGVVPLLTGLFDICLFGPLLGTPVSGKKVRAEG